MRPSAQTGGQEWTLDLPKMLKHPEGAHPRNVSTFGQSEHLRDDETAEVERRAEESMKTNDLFPITVKAVAETGTWEAAGSVFTEPDLGGDIVRFGAFRKTIADAEQRRRSLGLKYLWPFLYQHDRSVPIGGVTSAVEEEKFLRVRGELDLEDDDGKRAHRKMVAGTATGISFGYEVVSGRRDGDVYWLDELRVHEFSLVTLPMHPSARVIEVKAVVPYQNLPLADIETPWSASEARKRVLEWAGGDEVDWKKYRKAFLWWDRDNPELLGSYKFPIADIFDGDIKAVPRAIFAAAARLAVADIPETDKDGIRAHLARYYKKLDRVPPWEAKDDEEHIMAVVELVASMPDVGVEAARQLSIDAVERAAQRVLALRDLAVKAAATDPGGRGVPTVPEGPTLADLLGALARLAN